MIVEIGDAWSECDSRLIFRESESSFAVVPPIHGGVSSALVNDLELEVDHNGDVLNAWGYFPHPSTWRPTSCNPPKACRRTIRIRGDEEWTPGVSRRMNALRWDVLVNETSGWVCLGRDEFDEEASGVEFAPDSVAVIKNGSLIAIWLRPESLPSLGAAGK